MMNTWKKDLWLCTRISGFNAEIAKFSEPILFKGKTSNGVNYQPTGGYTNILQYGENITQYMSAILTPYEKWKNIFHEGDRVYLDGAVPGENETYYGEKANYVVDFAGNQNRAIKVVFKKI